jgi:OFA family oxalate/formate antiporter-like MFS transporter
LGVSGLILIAVNFVFLRDDPEKLGLLPWGETAPSTPLPPFSKTSFNYRAITKDRTFWLIGASYLFVSVAVYIVSDFIVTYGVVELKMSYAAASTLMSVLALTSIVGGFVLMTLSDYIGRAKSLVIIHSLLALSILLIIFTKANILWLRIGIGWFGFMYGPIFPMYAACARDYFPKEVAGRVIGLLTLLYGIGAMVGPILGGRLTDLMGSFRWPFGVGVFAALLASLIMGFVRKPEKFGEKREY